jgi:solute carrier family 25 protein 34/35
MPNIFCICGHVQVKTHLQSKANEISIAVGHQHKHAGMIDAFRSIYAQHGFMGLWRGTSSMIPRIAVANASQLLSFEKTHGKFYYALMGLCRITQASYSSI